MTNIQGREKIFISYCHADNDWLKRVQVHLSPLVRNGITDYWDDTKLQPGVKWKQSIIEKISFAKVAIFLVSADFLASDFINLEELPPLLATAEQGGTTILSIILSSCGFDNSPLSIYQTLNPPSRPLLKMERGEQEEVFNALSTFIYRLEEPVEQNTSSYKNKPSLNQQQKIQDAENYLFQGQFELAVKEASSILEHEPNNTDVLLIRARANTCIHKKDEDIIYDAAKALISVKGREDCVGVLQYANSLFLLRKDRLALDYINKLIPNKYPNTSTYESNQCLYKAVSLRMRIELVLGDYSNTIADADWLLSIDQSDGHAWYRKGKAYSSLENYNEAIRCLNLAIKYIPDDWVFYDERSLVYGKLKMDHEALNDCSKVLEKAPWYNYSRKYKAAVFLDIKKYPEALSELTLALMFDPNDDSILTMRAHAYFYLGDHLNAKKDAESALKHNSKNEDALTILEAIKKQMT